MGVKRSSLIFDRQNLALWFGLKDDKLLVDRPIGQFGLGVPAVRIIKELLGPQTKFFFMFRNPILWMLSEGVQGVIDWSELDNVTNRNWSRADHDGMDESMLVGQTLIHGFFARRACYADALESWMAVFPRENLLFL